VANLLPGPLRGATSFRLVAYHAWILLMCTNSLMMMYHETALSFVSTAPSLSLYNYSFFNGQFVLLLLLLQLGSRSPKYLFDTSWTVNLRHWSSSSAWICQVIDFLDANCSAVWSIANSIARSPKLDWCCPAKKRWGEDSKIPSPEKLCLCTGTYLGVLGSHRRQTGDPVTWLG
jgi:hypothetical protein